MTYLTTEIGSRRRPIIWITAGLLILLGILALLARLGSQHQTHKKREIHTTVKSSSGKNKISQSSSSIETNEILHSKDKAVVDRVWDDGTLTFKVGHDYVTVTPQGDVIDLPQEL